MLTALSLAILLGNIGTTSAHATSNYRTLRVYRTGYVLNGTTATGRRTGWGIVAVDPHVIPLHTHMYIPGYGHGYAEDTGGAVRGYHIDVWVPTVSMAHRMTGYVTIRIYR
jgi:3D (Asp-Asp-Asp) domain-containing protein